MRSYLLINEDIEKMRAEIISSKNRPFHRLIEQYKLYAEKELPIDHPPKSTTYMGMAMANLSLAYILTRQEHYLEEAKRWIFTCVNYPHWGNAFLVDVDLSAAWILFGMGIAYDWLKEDLTKEEREQIKDKLLLQGTRMFEFKIKTEGSGWSTAYCQNHNWINLNGLATVGYALLEECPSVQTWIDIAKENFDYVYKVLPDDGSDYEGVVYWRYGAMWLFVYAHLLKEREGIDYFKTCEFFKNTFYYRLYQAAPNLEEQINFGDCHDRRSGHSTAIYYKVAAEYNNGHAQKLANMVNQEFLYREAYESGVKPGILPECFFELLFYNPAVKEEEFDNLPLTKYFDDLGLFVNRSSWDRDATHFSFKCSNPGGKKQWKMLWELKDTKGYNCFGLSHQHPDNNSFILNASNTYFAIDDGYNRTVKASDHNVVLVDGQGYEDEGQNNIWKNYTPDMKGEIETYKTNDSYTYIVGETAKTYKKSLALKVFKRHVLYTNKSYYIMLDELESTDEHVYTWVMHSDAFPKNKDNKWHYQYGYGEMDLYHYSDVETEHAFVENNIVAVMTTQEPDKVRKLKMKGLHISNTVKKKAISFITVLAPKSANNDYVVKKAMVDGGYGVEITNSKDKEIVIYSEKGYFTYKNKQYNHRVMLFKEQENEIEEEICLCQ
jgi:hypothetical protein